ncbi:MAG: hypothetical protein ACKVTZ_17925 [Bacteroidia bacterium]
MQKLGISLVLFVMLAVSACKEPELPAIEKRERVYLHIVNLYQPIPSLDMDFEAFEQKQATIKDLQTFQSWPQGGYASLLSIHKPDSAKNVFGGLYFTIMNHFTGEVIFPKKIYDLQTVVPNTFAVIDVQGVPTVIRAADTFDSLNYKTSGVRFMDLSNNKASLSLVTTDSVVKHENMSYLGYTPFKKFPTGTYKFRLIDAQNVLDTVYRFDPITIQPGRNYAFYAYDLVTDVKAFYEKIEK